MSKLDDLKLKYLSEPRKAVRVYVSVAFFDLLIFGFLGLHLSLASYTEKRNKLNAVEAEVKKASDKRTYLSGVDKDIQEVTPYLPALSVAVPDTPEMQTYLMDLVTACARQGYVVQDLTAEDPLNGKVNLTVSMVGTRDGAPALVEAVENLPRFTTVTTVNMENVEGLYTIDLRVEVLYSDNKTLDLTQQPNATINKEFLSKEFKPAHE